MPFLKKSAPQVLSLCKCLSPWCSIPTYIRWFRDYFIIPEVNISKETFPPLKAEKQPAPSIIHHDEKPFHCAGRLWITPHWFLCRAFVNAIRAVAHIWASIMSFSPCASKNPRYMCSYCDGFGILPAERA